MATVFFKINNTQEKEVKTLMKEEGYTNKAEFFRFLVKFYKYHKSPEEIRFEKTTQELAEIIAKLDKKGKFKSLTEQLKDA
ncbi:MAG: hypothetical protein Q8P62_02750 [Candidatus Peregrinibacteria bacterium]|nr:hypothetical protein [Candidatus Peregrinibacteria bacterium]